MWTTSLAAKLTHWIKGCYRNYSAPPPFFTFYQNRLGILPFTSAISGLLFYQSWTSRYIQMNFEVSGSLFLLSSFLYWSMRSICPLCPMIRWLSHFQPLWTQCSLHDTKGGLEVFVTKMRCPVVRNLKNGVGVQIRAVHINSNHLLNKNYQK